MSTPLNLKSTAFVSDAVKENNITFGEYIDEKAKSSKVDAGLVRKIVTLIKNGEDFDDEIEDPKVQKRVNALMVEVKADIAAHAKNRLKWEKDNADAIQKRKEEKEQAKEAIAKDKDESSAALELGFSNKSLVTGLAKLETAAKSTVNSVLGKAFTTDESGLITIEEGVTKKDFITAFSGLVSVNRTTKAVDEAVNKTEAQLAYAAKATLGESWSNMFAKTPRDLSRIQGALRVFALCKESKVGLKLFTAMPLENIKSLTEVKITSTADEGGDKAKADSKNAEAKQELIKLAYAALKESESGKLTQIEVRNLVAKFKEENGVKGKIKMKFTYFVVIGTKVAVCGSEQIDKGLIGISHTTIDTNGNQLALDEKGNVQSKAITGPGKEVLEKLQAWKDQQEAAEKAKAKPAAGNKKKTAVAEDERDDDDDDEVVVTKKKKPAVVTEDEDEDEDELPGTKAEDEDDEDDDAPAPKKKATPAVDEDDDDEDTVVVTKKKKAPVDDDDDDEVVVPAKKGKKAPVVEDEEEDDEPVAPKKKGKKASVADDDDE